MAKIIKLDAEYTPRHIIRMGRLNEEIEWALIRAGIKCIDQYHKRWDLDFIRSILGNYSRGQVTFTPKQAKQIERILDDWCDAVDQQRVEATKYRNGGTARILQFPAIAQEHV